MSRLPALYKDHIQLKKILDRLRDDPPDDELAKMLADPDPAVVFAALTHVKNRTASSTEPTRLRSWAALLAKIQVGTCAEAQHLLADLYLALHRWLPQRLIPNWRAWNPEVSVELAWLRVELLLFPEKIKTHQASEIVLQALHLTKPEDLPLPDETLQSLGTSNDPHYELLALDLMQKCLESGAISPSKGYDLALSLSNSRFPKVVAVALTRLAEPWARCGPMPTTEIRRALNSDAPAVGRAAIAAARAWGADSLLELAMKDEVLHPLLRREAMVHLGFIGPKGRLDDVLHLAVTDPHLYGKACFDCLEAFHHRGLFVGAEHLDQLLAVYVANTDCAPDSLALLTFVVRQDLVRQLSDIEPNDDKWERLADVLPLLQADGVDVLIGNLVKKTEKSVLRRIFISTIKQVGGSKAEAIVLSFLKQEPRASLEALKWVGGESTAVALRVYLGVDQPEGTVAPFLRPYCEQALTLLWHLTADDNARAALRSLLNPADMPGGILNDLGGTIGREDLELLMFNKDELTAHDAIETLGQYGTSEAIPLITDLLLRHIADLNSALVERKDPDESYGYLHDAEPVVFDSVKRAIRQLGARLHERGKIRPAFLLRAATSESAGEILLAEVALDLIEKRKLDPGELRMLLEILEPLGYVSIPHRIRFLMRHKHPHVRKLAIRCLARHRAIGLAFNLGRLTEASDIETVRQALIALTELNAMWAVGFVTACLDHPNMNIKKSAAKALVGVGTVEALDKVLFWLGRHDNPGLRALLLEVVQAMMGRASTATLVAALEGATDPRQQDLLLQTLDHRITPPVVRSLVRGQSRRAEMVVGALMDGKIHLARGDLSDLVAEFYLHQLELPRRGQGKGKREVDALSEVDQIAKHGWSEKTIRQLLASDVTASRHTDWLVKNYLKEWLALISRLEGFALKNAIRMLAHVDSSRFDRQKKAVLAEEIPALLDLLMGDWLDPDDGEKIIKLLVQAVPVLSKPESLKVAADLRNLPPLPFGDGQGRYHLLCACDVVLSNSDVLTCLRDCRNTSNPSQHMKNILRHAFGRNGETEIGAEKWQQDVHDALRQSRVANLDQLRDHLPPSATSGSICAALVEYFPAADDEQQAELLEWMEAIQPLHAPSWTLLERAAHEEQTEAERQQRERHMDKMLVMTKSSERRQVLLSLLDHDDVHERTRAAELFLSWPDVPADHDNVLRVFLAGRLELDQEGKRFLARRLLYQGASDLAAEVVDKPVDWQQRLLSLAANLPAKDLEDCLPWVLALWRSALPQVSDQALACLKRMDMDFLMPTICEAVKKGELGYVDLLGGPVLQSPELDLIIKHLGDSGQTDRIERLRKWSRPGHLRSPAEAEDEQEAFTKLRQRPPAEKRDVIDIETERAHLIEEARGTDTLRVKRALKALMHHEGQAVVDVATNLVRHRDVKIRSQALRCLRRVADRDHYLRVTSAFLDDPQPDVQRSAIRVLCFAGYQPAINKVIGFLSHKSPRLQKDAVDGLIAIGEAALAPLIKAERRARPDQRVIYRTAIEAVEEHLARKECDTGGGECPR